MKSLVVEDDATSRLVMQEYLSAFGPCDGVAHGRDALEMFAQAHRDGAPYELVCLDIMMPELNGWEVCKTIRSHEEYNSTGILMVTAIGETLNDMTSELYGADDHVNKPFELQEVLTKVEEIISKHQADSF